MKSVLIIIGLIWGFNVCAKELTIAAGPDFPRAQLAAIFEPLSQQLKAVTGYELKVVSSTNYYFYWKDATRKKPDLSFDAPHVAAYRIQRLNYIPLVKTIEPTTYHLIQDNKQQPQTNTTEHLNTQKLITMQHPSIASILFEEWFAGSVVLPTRLIANYAWSDCIDSLNQGKAQAAIVPDWILTANPGFSSIKQSQPYLGRSILASPDLDPNAVAAIQSALMMIAKESDALRQLNTEKFVAVDQSEFNDYIDLIPHRYLLAMNDD